MNCKTLLTFSALLITLSSSAQIGKGSLFLGGNLNFVTSKQSDNLNRSTGFSINPSFGKAVKENLMLGFDIGYGAIRNKGSQDSVKNQNFSAGIFIRKYATLGKGFYLFGQGRLGMNYFDYKNSAWQSDYHGYSIALNLYPGIAYSVNRKLQLELGLPSLFNMDWQHSVYPSQNGVPKKTFDAFSLGTAISSTTNVNVGLRLLLNKS